MSYQQFSKAVGYLNQTASPFSFTNTVEQCSIVVENPSCEKGFVKEAKEIICKIKTDKYFAENFFYGSGKSAGKNISQIRSKIAFIVKKSYHIELSDKTIATLLYEHLYSDGKWTTLDSYKYRSSFFTWISNISVHVIMNYLVENGFIEISSQRRPGNVRIVWKSKSPQKCKMMLDDMVHIPYVHKFLTALYVERKTQEQIQNEFNYDEIEYENTLDKSEKTLKVILLNSEHYYDDFLRDKNPCKKRLSSEAFEVFTKTFPDSVSDSPLKDVLSQDPQNANLEKESFAIMLALSEKIFPNDMDRFIWQGRYIHDIEPVVMAEIIGKTRGYVDCRYNRLHKKFKKNAQLWWAQRNC